MDFKKSTILTPLVIFCLPILLNGCATMIHGKRSSITVNTGYDNATVKYTDRKGQQSVVGTGQVVSFVMAKRDLGRNVIEVSRPHCKVATGMVHGTFDPVSLVNLLTVPILGFVIDACTGAINEPVSNTIEIKPLC